MEIFQINFPLFYTQLPGILFTRDSRDFNTIQIHMFCAWIISITQLILINSSLTHQGVKDEILNNPRTSQLGLEEAVW